MNQVYPIRKRNELIIQNKPITKPNQIKSNQLIKPTNLGCAQIRTKPAQIRTNLWSLRDHPNTYKSSYDHWPEPSVNRAQRRLTLLVGVTANMCVTVTLRATQIYIIPVFMGIVRRVRRLLGHSLIQLLNARVSCHSVKQTQIGVQVGPVLKRFGLLLVFMLPRSLVLMVPWCFQLRSEAPAAQTMFKPLMASAFNSGALPPWRTKNLQRTDVASPCHSKSWQK